MDGEIKPARRVTGRFKALEGRRVCKPAKKKKNAAGISPGAFVVKK